jgi:hypothetical protein
MVQRDTTTRAALLQTSFPHRINIKRDSCCAAATEESDYDENDGLEEDEYEDLEEEVNDVEDLMDLFTESLEQEAGLTSPVRPKRKREDEEEEASVKRQVM